MKKKSLIISFIVILIILIVGVAIAGFNYKNLQMKKQEIAKFNLTYEEYNKENLNGLDITTLINKATSHNEKNKILKDEEGLYKLDEENSIEIYVKMIINDTTYRMERINNLGMGSFIEYFGEVRFKCIDVQYHKNGKIASMTFEAMEY